MAHYRASVEEAEALVLELLRQHGASSASAASVARALVEAQLQGKPNVGLAHLPVYLDSLKEGRADGQGEVHPHAVCAQPEENPMAQA